tara:strand:+ start:16 stop:567 length:552 start_codon:yes stop_codon:yes gene_type:complete
MTGIFKINNNEVIGSDGTFSGTIGSGATFPVGHVLQVVHDTTRETNTLDQTFTNYYEQSIQLKSASSDVIGIFHHGWAVSGVQEGFGLKVYRNNSATVTTSHTLVYNPTVTDGVGPLQGYNTGGQLRSSASYNFKDTLSGFSVGNTLYYGFFFRRRSTSSTMQIPPDDQQDGVFSLTLMEVQK